MYWVYKVSVAAKHDMEITKTSFGLAFSHLEESTKLSCALQKQSENRITACFSCWKLHLIAPILVLFNIYKHIDDAANFHELSKQARSVILYFNWSYYIKNLNVIVVMFHRWYYSAKHATVSLSLNLPKGITTLHYGKWRHESLIILLVKQ